MNPEYTLTSLPTCPNNHDQLIQLNYRSPLERIVADMDHQNGDLSAPRCAHVSSSY
jgi:hypothetical protein